MRGTVPGLVNPHPIGLALPALFLDDDFTQRFTAGLDEVLAPVLLTLDCLDAYLDLDLAPPDFLDWLAGWVAMPVAEEWPTGLRRELARHAVELHRWRGTAHGIALHARILTGGEVTVTDTGGTTWSGSPGADPPASGPPEVRVRVQVADPAAVDQVRLREIVSAAVPAHVRIVLEVIGS
jgi:phage tail-like protein